MDKSPDAFRTISEVADHIDVPQHVLRFWETRFPQIKPLKRGGGRRYYRPDDIDLLRGIRHLLYGEGYTIKGVQRILKADGARFVQSIGRGEAPAPARSPSAHDDSPEEEDVAAQEAPGDDEEAPGPGLDQDDIQRLRLALGELTECQRVLKALTRLDERSGADEASD